MPAPHGLDLRERAVRAYEETDLSQAEVAKLFDIGEASLKRWTWRKRDHNTVAPAPMGGRRQGKLSADDDAFIATVIEVRADITLAELTEVVREVRQVDVSPAAISRALARLNISRKKGGSGRPKRTVPRSNKLGRT